MRKPLKIKLADIRQEQLKELIDISAAVIGRQIKQIVRHNPRLKERIYTIVSLQNSTQQHMAEAMVQDRRPLELVKKWFHLFSKGIND